MKRRKLPKYPLQNLKFTVTDTDKTRSWPKSNETGKISEKTGNLAEREDGVPTNRQ